MKAGPSVLLRAYRALLWLYPADFQSAFGGEMAEVFASRLQEAVPQGLAAVLAVGWHEVRDLPGSLAREHAAALRTAAAQLQTLRARQPWPVAVLACVPGLLVIWGYWGFELAPAARPWLSQWLPWLLLGGVGLHALLVVVRERSLPAAALPAATLPAAALPALGLGAGVLLLLGLPQASGGQAGLVLVAGVWLLLTAGGLAWARRRGVRLGRAAWLLLAGVLALGLLRALWHLPEARTFGGADPLGYLAYQLIFGLLPAAALAGLVSVGAGLARRHGLAAALFVLAPLPLLIDLLVDPTYGLRSSPVAAQAVWAPLLRSLLYGLLLVAAPLWLLRARHGGEQARGVLLTTALALAAIILIPALYWRMQTLDLFLLAQVAGGVLAALAASAGQALQRAAPGA